MSRKRLIQLTKMEEMSKKNDILDFPYWLNFFLKTGPFFVGEHCGRCRVQNNYLSWPRWYYSQSKWVINSLPCHEKSFARLNISFLEITIRFIDLYCCYLDIMSRSLDYISSSSDIKSRSFNLRCRLLDIISRSLN